MNIFGIFQKSFKSKVFETTVDILFGKLERVSPRIWSGKVHFAPLNKEIEIVIESEQLPDQEQREFYRELERCYEEISSEIGDALYDEFSHAEPNFPRKKIWDKFELESVSILKSAETDWEISYFCADDDHYFDVGMNAWKVEHITING